MLNKVLLFVELAPLAIAIVLEDLSDERMGVMRYLVFKQRVWGETWFAPLPLTIIKVLLLLGVLFGVYIAVKKQAKQGLWIIVANVLSLVFTTFVGTDALMAYHFFLLSLLVITLCAYLRLGLR